MIKKISLCMASIVFVVMIVMNFQRFEPVENASEINLEILKSVQAQSEEGGVATCKCAYLIFDWLGECNAATLQDLRPVCAPSGTQACYLWNENC